jgi:hypothetical protein
MSIIIIIIIIIVVVVAACQRIAKQRLDKQPAIRASNKGRMLYLVARQQYCANKLAV